MVSFKIAAVAAALVSFAGAASAATETFNFLGWHSGTYYTSKEFTSDMGNTVDVSMGTYNGFISSGSAGGGYVGQWTGYGLGVCAYNKGCDGQHYVDGYGSNEYLKFSFGYDVVIESIQFRDYGDNYFDLTLSDGSDLINRTYDSSGSYDTATDANGSMFFIGAYNDKSGFKVKSITVSYDMSEVPLPAAGFLLLGGLGGLAALKRRRKA